MTALSVVPPLDEQRGFAARDLLRARAAACRAGRGDEFDRLTADIVIARWRLAAAIEESEKSRHLQDVFDLTVRRRSLIQSLERVG